ncbi:Cas9 inhibitor AcrIIA9 family protein [Pectinatus haikarae]|uniref:Cas9 inhibitor AcrIIA9 family protein n=1 Tax=Pectinatus haikarae TaxID=349096 RepID=UPI0018C5DC42|nr:Cas9 inhibitor AcrIIA9 family protein [Pectinatus haikarae]
MANFEAAHEKLINEMKGHENIPIYESVLDYLMRQAENTVSADQIIDSKKNIKGAVDHMTAAARKKATGGSYVMTDDEGFKIIDEYYGFGAQALAENSKNQASKRLDIDFDDL